LNTLFDKWSTTTDATEKQSLANQIIKEIKVHSNVEETIVYAEYRTKITNGDHAADKSIHEHQEIKNTLSELENKQANDSEYDTKFRKMFANLNEHIQEEEKEFFPQLEKAFTIQRLEELGGQVNAAKNTSMVISVS